MRNSFDYYQHINRPNMYLYNPDRTPIGYVLSENRHLVLRFNDLSELTFTVPKIDETEAIYTRLESKRLLFIDDIGWFQITSVVDTLEGNREQKEVTAKSHQIQLSSRGFISEERVYMFYNPNDPLDTQYDSLDKSAIPSVVGQLYQQVGMQLALYHYDDTKDYKDWTITYINPALWFKAKSYDKQYEAADDAGNICRSFESNETFGYDFIINDVESAFEVVFEFDFLHHTVAIKTLDEITQPTNIYLSLDNVVESLSVTEDSENIVTVLSCNGEDLDIRTVNPMGTNYLVNFDYYKTTTNRDGSVQYPWMSKPLVDALTDWQEEWNKWQEDDEGRTGHTKSYSTLVNELQGKYLNQIGMADDIQYANLRVTDLQAARDLQISRNNANEGRQTLISVEDVLVNNASLEPDSVFKVGDKGLFTESQNITAYLDIPTINSDKKSYKPSSNANKTGTAQSMLLDFLAGEKDENGNYYQTDDCESYLYFFDTTARQSYCKLLVSAEVGVIKNSDGEISNYGTTELRGVQFTVSQSVASGAESGDLDITCSVEGSSGSSQTFSKLKSNSYFIYNGTRYKVMLSADGITTIYCFYVSGFRRYTMYGYLLGDNNWIDRWEKRAKALQKDSDDVAAEITELQNEMVYINEQCHVQKYIKRRGEDLYNEFSNYWIEGEYTNDHLSTEENTEMKDEISLAKELMTAGQKELERVSQPTFDLKVNSIDFIKIFEFKPFTDELELGKIITVERDDKTRYRPALVSIEYDLDTSDGFTMEFSTAAKLDDTAMTFADLINESVSTSRTVAANWSNLTDYWKNKDRIENLLNSPLDRTLRAAQSNMSNQEFTIDTTGLLGRKWNDNAQTSFSPEQVRIVNNTILFTDDNWQTIRTALGKVYYADDSGVDKTAYGLVAEVLVGSLIVGDKLKIENSNNTITLDDRGLTILRDSGDEGTAGDMVFQASSSGKLFVKGSIYATELILGDGVEIKYANDTGASNGYVKKSDLDNYVTVDSLGDVMADTYATKVSVEELQTATETNLEEAKTEINETITANKEELTGAIATNKTELETAITTGDDAVKTDIAATYATIAALEALAARVEALENPTPSE